MQQEVVDRETVSDRKMVTKLTTSSCLPAEASVEVLGTILDPDGQRGLASQKIKISAHGNPKPNDDNDLGKSEGFSATTSLALVKLGETLNPKSHQYDSRQAKHHPELEKEYLPATIPTGTQAAKPQRAAIRHRTWRRLRRHRWKHVRWDVTSGHHLPLAIPLSAKQREPNFQIGWDLVNDLSSDGFKAIWMLDPGIKHEEGYFVYDSGTKNDVWVQQADCRPYIGEVWPGQGVFPDFTQEKVCSWWAKLVKDFIANGVDGIWNDMNEPAIFKTVTKTMPESNVHRGDVDLGGFQDHSHHHNVYGLLMARSTYEGMKIVTSEKRPFVLTRAGFVGSQRYATTWTGDNLSHWDHLHMSLSMVLLLCLSGQPLSGPDIGGFSANVTPKLFGRWMGLGAWFPFCCGHSESGTADHEPWSFGEECAEVCHLALLRRYRFLPHLYTLFFMAHTKGNPVPAPTFFADPTDPNLRKIENSFLLSPLLICSSTTPEKGSHQLLQQFPRGIWMSFDFDDPHPDLPTLQLQDETGRAEGLFEDDGDGYGFSKGEYLFTYYVADLQSLVVTVKVSKVEGSWTRPERHLHVHLLLGGGAKLDALGTDGKVIQIRMPSENEVSDLTASSKKQYETLLENATNIPAVEEQASQKGDEFEDIDGDEDEDDAVAIPPTVAARAPGLGQQLFYGQGPSVNTMLNGLGSCERMMQFQIAAAVVGSMVVSFHHSAMTLELHNQFHHQWLPTAAVEISNTMDCTYDELFSVIQDSEQQLGLFGILRRTTWLDSCNAGVSADVGDEGNPCRLPSAASECVKVQPLEGVCGAESTPSQGAGHDVIAAMLSMGRQCHFANGGPP
ncbi:alpha-glucosidase-like [Aristolochia californica]|uniref:alpha-glucosidase-like n=1 Tax=Aristolochia californica TaxID=171875 RepID=UPI0035DDC46E